MGAERFLADSKALLMHGIRAHQHGQAGLNFTGVPAGQLVGAVDQISITGRRMTAGKCWRWRPQWTT